jgi:hypothetical protein
MKLLPAVALAFAALISPALAVDVTVDAITAAPADFDGQEVSIKGCLLTTYIDIIGGQCSTAPLDPAKLIYVDADTLDAEGKAALAGCDVLDINNMCLIDIVGTASVDGRGHPLIKNAKVVVSGKASAM